jgi:hypothetical protein
MVLAATGFLTGATANFRASNCGGSIPVQGRLSEMNDGALLKRANNVMKANHAHGANLLPLA